MENFVVSARKYRPVTFDSVVGQTHITTTLKNAIATNQLAQAFLFCGPRGVGKTTCARILAKTINCQDLGPEVEACGKCESCVSFGNNASLNIHELDAASNNSVEDIRNLTDQVRYPPQSGRYKIYIIDEVHMLSSSAFNAFLKTLEEPPSYAIFILATTEKHKILPTILSRCQIFDFNRIQPKDISDHLAAIAVKEEVKAEYEALELIAQKADGGLRDALSMFDLNVTFATDRTLRYREVLDNLHILDYDYYFQMTDAFLQGSVSKALLLLDEIIRKGFDSHLFVVGLLKHFRNLMVSKDAATVTLLDVSESVRQKYLEQSAQASLSFLLSALSVGGQCDINFKTAKNQRLHVEICLMKLAHLSETLNLSTIAVDETAKKKVDTGSVIREEPAAYVKPAAPDPALPRNPSAPTNGRLKSTRNLMARAASDVTREVIREAQPAQPIGVASMALTFENLQQAWSEFIQLRKIGGKSTSTEEVALDRAFELRETTVLLPLDNDLQQEKLTEIKGELLVFLRSRFDEPRLEVAARVAPQDVKRMPYTPLEKLEYMMDKNPLLKELKQRLGLDADF